MRVAVIGAGAWGTTLASVVASRQAVVLWARRPEAAKAMRERRENVEHLRGHRLPDELAVTASLADALAGADVVAMAVPTAGMRAVLGAMVPHLAPRVPVVSLAKGFERGTGARMTEIVAEVLPRNPPAVLTGPNLAGEILAGHAAASVLAAHDEALAAELRPAFATASLRVYTHSDVVGCEVAGALKNVIAIASGMADGLGTGDNTRATVITRGLAELSRLGTAMGGDATTFAGLAGMGDLIATCSSPLSRNRAVGAALGRGERPDVTVAAVGGVAEGVATSAVALALGRRHGVELPITEEVHAVCHLGRPAREAYERLLARPERSEVHGHRPR